jgi:glycyl-tRNA synthetase
MELHERIFELSLMRSFFFPSNEPYGSLSGFYDYGPVGALMKRKIENLWRRKFIKEEGFHEVETSIVTPEQVLVASGHVGNFADPVVECESCKTRVRGDTLVEDKLVEKHGEKWDGKLESIDKEINESNIKCPSCGGKFKPAYMFNLMFKTGIGGDRLPAYNRPETAQGIFTLFNRLYKNHGTKLPIAAGQVGRSFRNEISPRKGLVRMREFTQMELEYFFNPSQGKITSTEELEKTKMRMQLNGENRMMDQGELLSEDICNSIMAHFLAKEWEFYKMVGIDEEKMFMRVLDKNEIPHYSNANIDMEVKTSFGMIETIGNAYRTDFDLSQHAKHSGQDFEVHIQEENKKITPHVVEVSMGFDRMFFAILEHCYCEKTEDRNWEWFNFPPAIAPYHVAVFPLMKKDGMKEKAEEISAKLRGDFDVAYRDSGSIGKRYARADEIGIPAAVTVDYESLENDDVTLRYRNNGEQIRIKIEKIPEILNRFIRGDSWESIKADFA